MLDVLSSSKLLVRVVGGQRAGEGVDFGVGELASTHFLLEQDVQLAVGPALGLWKAEEGPDDAEEAHASPEETGFGTPVPGGRVQHPGGDDVADEAADVVQVAGEHDGLLAETGRGQLGDEGVADGADGGIVDEGVDEKHGADGPLSGRVVARGQAQEADDEQQHVEDDETPQVEGTAAKDGDEIPGAEDTDGTEGVLDERHGEGVVGIEAGLLVEVGRVAHEAGAAPGLDEPDDGADFGSSQIGLLEAVEVGGAFAGGLFHLVGVDHHGDRLVGVERLELVAGG